jgi:hypothetical protein
LLRERSALRNALCLAMAGTLVVAAVGGCDWFNDPVEANLPPDTEIVTCPGAGSVVAGDDVLLEWTGDDPDGTVSSFLWTLDGSEAEETDETSLVAEGVTAGDHVFTVAAVDDEGEADATPDTCAFTASEPGGLVERVVLAEMLTTKFCSNCWKAELALDRMIRQYGEEELTVVAYHYDDDPQIPPDPVATPESNERCDWYYDNTDVGGSYAIFPLVIFDGGRYVVGASDTAATKVAYEFEIELRRDVGSPLTLELSGAVDSGRGDIQIVVRVRDTLTGGPNVVRAVVVEDAVVSGSDHFDFVARDLLEPETLTISSVGDTALIERSFELDPSWDVGELGVVAFIQDESTAEILQSVRLMTK